MNVPDEPTSEQCENNERMKDVNHRPAYACWYPQMGGYVGKCVVVLGNTNGKRDDCFDVYIWHDGEFPFSGEGVGCPVELHHCMPSQFVTFGKLVLLLQGPRKFKIECYYSLANGWWADIFEELTFGFDDEASFTTKYCETKELAEAEAQKWINNQETK